jgi:hypothetical protein
MKNETHKSGAILIFFSLYNHGGRRFRLVVWHPKSDGMAGEIECEECAKDALGQESWMEFEIEHDLCARIVGMALHKGPVPAPGLDLGTVSFKP